MKDFFILVKALLAANVKVTPAKKQKNNKSPHYLRSLIISMLSAFFVANLYIILSSVAKYVLIDSMDVSYQLKQETLSNFFLTGLSIFIVAYLLMVTLQSYSTFFPRENEFILFLPIEGKRLFFARYFITFLTSLALIGPSLLAHIICYLIYTGAGVLSYFTGIIFALVFFIAAPMIGYILIMASIRFFKLFEKKRNKVIFFTILISVTIILYAGFYLICYLPITTYDHYQLLFSVTKYLFWIGYLPKLFIDLNSYWYLLVFFAFIGLFISLYFLAIKISDKFYSLYLSTNEKSKSKQKNKNREKVNDQLIKEKLSITDNDLKSYIKRERGNIKAYLGYYITQTIAPLFALAILTVFSVFIKTILGRISNEGYLDGRHNNIALLVSTILLSYSAGGNSLIFVGVSIEKRNFYMLKTFPIDRKKYYLSKLITTSLLYYPVVVICGIIISIFNKFNPLEAIGVILYSSSIFLISQLIYSIFGFLNPNFNLTFGATNQTVAARGTVKYSFYQMAISFLGDEPVNLLIISGIFFVIFNIPVTIMIYVLTLVNGVIIFFMSKLTMKSLDFAFSKEFNI